MAAEREAAQKLSPADVVAHYVSQPLPRDRVATRQLIESTRRQRHDDDCRRGNNADP
jgi:hypothetical protein